MTVVEAPAAELAMVMERLEKLEARLDSMTAAFCRHDEQTVLWRGRAEAWIAGAQNHLESLKIIMMAIGGAASGAPALCPELPQVPSRDS